MANGANGCANVSNECVNDANGCANECANGSLALSIVSTFISTDGGWCNGRERSRVRSPWLLPMLEFLYLLDHLSGNLAKPC